MLQIGKGFLWLLARILWEWLSHIVNFLRLCFLKKKNPAADSCHAKLNLNDDDIAEIASPNVTLPSGRKIL